MNTFVYFIVLLFVANYNNTLPINYTYDSNRNFINNYDDPDDRISTSSIPELLINSENKNFLMNIEDELGSIRENNLSLQKKITDEDLQVTESSKLSKQIINGRNMHIVFNEKPIVIDHSKDAFLRFFKKN